MKDIHNKQIKIFHGGADEVQRQVNKFLNKTNITIEDIQMSMGGTNSCIRTNVMVIYSEKDD